MSGIKDKIGSASNWVTVATAAVGLYFAVRAGLTLGSTIIVCFYLALASVVWLYPWKYSTLPPEEGFYKVMLISCRVLLLAPIIIAVAWATACLFWQQSPGMLVEKIKTAFVNEPTLIMSKGHWDAHIDTASFAPREVIVGLPIASGARCVDAEHALRIALGELTPDKAYLWTIFLLLAFSCFILAVLESLGQFVHKMRMRKFG